MAVPLLAPAAAPENAPADEEIARRVAAGEVDLFEVLMRRHNTRVYRAVRSVLRDEAEVEDAMQQAYVSAFLALPRFAGRSKFSTWLTRIAINEALGRRRRASRWGPPDAPRSEADLMALPAGDPGPERRAEDRQMARLIESAVDALPEIYRTVFVLRDVDELATEEAAEALGLTPDAVKTRLHRARALVRQALYASAAGSAAEAFPFQAPRCDRVVAAVLARVHALAAS